MKKCTKWRIISAVLWLAVGGWLIYEVTSTWYAGGCDIKSLLVELAFYGVVTIVIGVFIDWHICAGFREDEEKFEYR